MGLLILWILASILVGYLGRKRAVGFWGVFFFSMIFSPVIGALALAFGRPSKGAITEQAQALQRVAPRPGMPLSGRSPGPVRPSLLVRWQIRSFVVSWVLLVVLFSGIYWFLDDFGQNLFRPSVFRSVEVGTGLPFDSEQDSVVVAASIQRFLSVLIVVGMLSYVVAERVVKQIRDASEQNNLKLEELGVKLGEGVREMAEQRKLALQELEASLKQHHEELAEQLHSRIQAVAETVDASVSEPVTRESTPV
jgi:hypothetical protein